MGASINEIEMWNNRKVKASRSKTVYLNIKKEQKLMSLDWQSETIGKDTNDQY